jgi:hypothetical protein
MHSKAVMASGMPLGIRSQYQQPMEFHRLLALAKQSIEFAWRCCFRLVAQDTA